jgi:hypothetical protein
MPPMVYWADGALGLRLAKIVNNAMAEASRAHPDRFVFLATLPMQDPEAAITGRTFTAEQQQWLDRIRHHLLANLSIGREDFELVGFANAGGWGRANRAFGDTLTDLLTNLNEALAAS